MIEIPLSTAVAIAGSAEALIASIETHRANIESHTMGKPGKPAPVAHDLIAALVKRVPAPGPIAERGPDRIVIAPYRIIDDTPKPEPELSAEMQRALDTLRATISG